MQPALSTIQVERDCLSVQRVCPSWHGLIQTGGAGEGEQCEPNKSTNKRKQSLENGASFIWVAPLQYISWVTSDDVLSIPAYYKDDSDNKWQSSFKDSSF